MVWLGPVRLGAVAGEVAGGIAGVAKVKRPCSLGGVIPRIREGFFIEAGILGCCVSPPLGGIIGGASVYVYHVAGSRRF